jgi:hypothetical protein
MPFLDAIFGCSRHCKTSAQRTPDRTFHNKHSMVHNFQMSTITLGQPAKTIAHPKIYHATINKKKHQAKAALLLECDEVFEQAVETDLEEHWSKQKVIADKENIHPM